MTLAWYDPTNHHVSTDKNDPAFTPLGQLWPLDVPREWVGLTRTQIQDVYFAVLEEHRGGHQMQGQLAFGEALQEKIKELNSA
jgi:hypothetical protein